MFRKYLNQIKKSKAKTYISLAILIAAITALTAVGSQKTQAYRMEAGKESCDGNGHNWKTAMPGHFAVVWLSHIFEKTVNYLFREGKISGCSEMTPPHPVLPYPNAAKTMSDHNQTANTL